MIKFKKLFPGKRIIFVHVNNFFLNGFSLLNDRQLNVGLLVNKTMKLGYYIIDLLLITVVLMSILSLLNILFLYTQHFYEGFSIVSDFLAKISSFIEFYDKLV